MQGATEKLALSTVMRTLPSRAYSACQALLGPVPNAFFLVSFCSQHVFTVDADDVNVSKAQIVYKDAVGPCVATALGCRNHAGREFGRVCSLTMWARTEQSLLCGLAR